MIMGLNTVEVPVKSDTIRLGDLSFEFNSSEVDSSTISNLKAYFKNINIKNIKTVARRN